MTKEFKILSIKKRPQVGVFEDVISHVKFQIIATEDEASVVYVGECSLNLPENEFTPFFSLNEEEVITWVRSVINETKLDELLAKLIIREKYGGPIEAELPWLS